jgi:hypothetical protein
MTPLCNFDMVTVAPRSLRAAEARTRREMPPGSLSATAADGREPCSPEELVSAALAAVPLGGQFNVGLGTPRQALRFRSCIGFS